jgi:hypothetical protein
VHTVAADGRLAVLPHRPRRRPEVQQLEPAVVSYQEIDFASKDIATLLGRNINLSFDYPGISSWL